MNPLNNKNYLNNTMNALLHLRLDDPKQSSTLSKSLHEKLQPKHSHKIIKHRKKHKKHNKNNVVFSIDELGDDLLFLILSRTDSWNQLVQCQSVSKRWNILTSQPNFVDINYPKLLPFTLYVKNRWKTSLISEHPFFQSQNPGFLFDLDFRGNEDYQLRPVGSYSDLLIYCYQNRYCYRFEPIYYFFFNPITKKYIKLKIPTRNNYDDEGKIKAIGCAGYLEGITSVVKKGEQEGFRFVRFVSTYMEVFSFENGEWISYSKSLNFGDHRLQYMHFISHNSVTLNNKMHWLVDDSILVIDPFIDDITWYRLIKLPCLRSISTIGVCRDRLRLSNFVYKSKFETTATLNVWDLEHEDDLNTSKWVDVCVKEVTTAKMVQVQQHVNVDTSLEGVYPISFHPHESDVVYLKNKNRIVRYNCRRETFKLMLEDDNDNWVIFPLVNPLIGW